MAYGKILSTAGVDVIIINYEGAIHAFMQFHDTSQACREAVDYCGAVIKKALSA